MQWTTLEEIYDDYIINKLPEIEMFCKELEVYLRSNLSIQIHSIKCRPKDAEHLIEKIIRKRGIDQSFKYKDIDKNKYIEIIQDLIGIRILTYSKENWEDVFEWLSSIFPFDTEDSVYMSEAPIAYTRYGDRDVYKDKIKLVHSNKGYRSQHYIIWYKKLYCEIQVRTLSEEVFGEFDHMVKYPYRNDNRFLIRYTSTISQLTNCLDEMISTCFQMNNSGWEYCSNMFSEDKYRDWKNISQIGHVDENKKQSIKTNVVESEINIGDYSSDSLLRRGN